MMPTPAFDATAFTPPNEADSSRSDVGPFVTEKVESGVPDHATQKLGTVLVVDDEIVSRSLLSHQLEHAGYHTRVAEDGRQALDAIRVHEIDVVLMDISMPVMDGFATLRMIRQMHKPNELPVIMMTASEASEQVVECFNEGANDYVSKPVELGVVLVRIEAQLILKRTQDELRESEQRYALASQGTRDGIWDWNLESGDIYLSPRWLDMVGIADPDWKAHGTSWLDLVYHEDRDRVRADLESHLCGDTSHFETEMRMPDQNGGFRWMLCRGLAVRNPEGMATRIAGSLTDITEGKVADALTRLPNRTLFHDRVRRCVEQFKRNPSRKFAIMYMDVDDFKLINDTLGHDIGDEFLIELAARLEGGLRKSEAVLARLGGDEFGVLLENIQHIEEAVEIATRLLERIRIPFKIANREILSQGSFGVVAVSTKNASVDQLIRQADAAMYHAKKYSESRICVFDERMLSASNLRLELGAELKNAIRRDELSLSFQPIVDVESQRTAGFEALARWHHPIHGDVPPDQFIPLAESNGMIIEIGSWVLHQACQQVAVWNETTQREIIISVNVSVRQLSVPGFIETVQSAITASGIQPSQLKLEVTESMLMQSPDEMIRLLQQLKMMGVTTGIDDFGTGYSSLAYLHQMPLNVLKIDRSFITGVAESDKHQAIVRSIIALARSLELEVIAEGIETEEQAEFLRSLGCDYFQGYHYSRPVRPERATGMLDVNWSS